MPMSEMEHARRQLMELKQKGIVLMYNMWFHTLNYKILEMTSSKAFSLFMRGLKPKVREQIGFHLEGDMTQAMQMDEKVDVWRRTKSDARKMQEKGKMGAQGKQQKSQKNQSWGNRSYEKAGNVPYKGAKQVVGAKSSSSSVVKAANGAGMQKIFFWGNNHSDVWLVGSRMLFVSALLHPRQAVRRNTRRAKRRQYPNAQIKTHKWDVQSDQMHTGYIAGVGPLKVQRERTPKYPNLMCN